MRPAAAIIAGCLSAAAAAALAVFAAAPSARAAIELALESQVQMANRVIELYNAGRYEEALALAEKSLTISEKEDGPESANVASWLTHIALALEGLGRYEDAIPHLKRALVIREKILGPDHPDTATVLNNLGILYDNLGRFAEAEAHHKRALAILEKVYGSDHPRVATTLNNLGLVYMSLARYAEAEVLLKRSLSISEQVDGPDHANTATSLANLSVLYAAQNRLAEAEQLQKRALAINEKIYGPDHPNTANALNNLAEIYRVQGRFSEAEPLFKRALAIDERTGGPNGPDVALDLSNLAALYDDVGRYSEAEAHLIRALAILEKNFGSVHPQIANSLTNLASVLSAQGRLDEAEPLYQRALAIDEKIYGLESPDTATSIVNLASLNLARGRIEEALKQNQRALAIYEKVFGPQHDRTALALNNLAYTYMTAGRYTDALPLAKRALAILEKYLGPDHPSTATTVGVVGAIHHRQGALAEAETYYRRGLAILEKVYAPTAAPIGVAGYWLSVVLLERGKADEALAVARRSVEVLAARRTRAAAAQLKGNSSEQLSYNDYFTQLVRSAYAVAKAKPQLERALRLEGFAAAQLQANDETGQAVARMASRLATGSDALARLLREQQELLKRLPALDRLIATALGSSDPATRAQAEVFRRESDRIGAHLAGIDAALRRDHGAYAELIESKPLGLAETQALLRPEEAIVFMLAGTRETFLFAVSKSNVEWATAPATATDLARDIATLRRQLDPAQWTVRPLQPFDRALSHKLHRALWHPLEAALNGKTQVFVVPTGPLTGMPLSVLVAEAPKGGAAGDVDPQALRDTAWLMKRHALITLPSVSSLKALRLYASRTTGSEPFAGFGDPSFDLVGIATRLPNIALASPPTRATDGKAIAILAAPQARVTGGIERSRTIGHPIWLRPSTSTGTSPTAPSRALRLASTLGRRGAATPLAFASIAGTASDTGSVASVFRGSEPDPEKLRQLDPLPATAAELRALAKALGASETADVFLRERATEAQVKSLDLSRKRVIAFATHGLMAGDMGLGEPGLVFTPPGTPSERDDGYLAASEVAGLNLKADWIILSACNTAAGDTPGAKGLSGLARAFFLAGSKSLLVSHWPVWDTAAMKLTTGAVTNMQKNPTAGRAEALRQSMLTLMNDRSAPYYAHPAAWAPFVLVGESR